MNLTRPKALRRGDTIGVVAPAGPVDREKIDRALNRVQKLGFRTKSYGNLYRSSGYLAGDDATRASEFMAAFADPETVAVWCARGGYGVVRMFDRLDFDIIRRHPKVFIGFSDISALHVAFQQRAGLITFHGPNLQDGFGKPDDMLDANAKALWRAVSAEMQEESPGYKLPVAELEDVKLTALSGGVARGTLTGGNLAVLVGLMGTPYEMETAGRILFIEDVSERHYRIDRYLAQLALAGKLQAAAGLLVGSFSYDDGDPPEPEGELAALLELYIGGLGVPVVTGFPAGHAKYNLTLPMGAQIELNADTLSINVLDHTVSTD